MKPDDEICCCHHVQLRKLWHFARRNRPARASQMSDCLGAGTGCGWCIPILKKIHIWAQTADDDTAGKVPKSLLDITPEAYAEKRRDYIKNKKPKNTF